MKKIDFRLLKASEIEVRPGITKNKGYAELLLFQNSRVAMEILDETFGMDWASDYKVLNGVTYCGIAFLNKDTNSYLWRWDCGSPTEIEVEKGTAADAFKRAAVKVGIARELYSSPKIRVACPDTYYNKEGKLIAKFYVSEIGYDENRHIKDLTIVDWNNKVVFDFKDGKEVEIKEELDEETDRVDVLKAVCAELKESVEDKKQLKKFYYYYEERCENFDSWNVKIVRKLWEKWISK